LPENLEQTIKRAIHQKGGFKMYNRHKRKYWETFGKIDDVPCNHCLVEVCCEWSQRDNYTPEEIEVNRKNWKKAEAKLTEEAGKKFEKDYLNFKLTGKLPPKYDPHHFDVSHYEPIDYDDYDDCKCPYINEYSLYYLDDDEIDECSVLDIYAEVQHGK
jgi:hypothetical protein